MDTKNMPFRAYPVRKNDVDQGYTAVPMDADRQYFKPSVADVRLGQCSMYEEMYGDIWSED